MIISGYQGIGKSSLAGFDGKVIDLESGNFWVDTGDGGKYRSEHWCKTYVNIACHLSEQGFTVFVSCHREVREELRKRMDEGLCKALVICPSLELKDEWLKRLEVRFESSKLEKDYRACKNAEENYDRSITELIEGELPCLVIKNMDYSLREAIFEPLWDNETIEYIPKKRITIRMEEFGNAKNVYRPY